jgi:hypothetical protein
MIPAASWTVVMGSGIVSIDLYSDQPVLSAIMLWFAAGAWLLLAVVLGARLADQRDRFALEVSSPASLTGVAGTAVLGTRLTMQDYHVAAVALLAVSGLGWALLLMPVLRAAMRSGWRGVRAAARKAGSSGSCMKSLASSVLPGMTGTTRQVWSMVSSLRPLQLKPARP